MHWDAIVVGSGFGGSVSALRLAEKGFRVLVLEKGRRFAAEDFPRSNREVRKWLWAPKLGCTGPFQMTFLPHITAFTGVGVGGGSLVYANTLPVPEDGFFQASSWAHLADWRKELEPHYLTAQTMLGATQNRLPADADRALEGLASRLGRSKHFAMNPVAVYFGKPGVTQPDPFFDGRGPDRAGCVGCGGCMLGCRHNAKNTLDKNYLYLAEKLGVEVRANSEVSWIEPSEAPAPGYRVRCGEEWLTADRVFLAGGVLGTVPLLLKLKEGDHGLPNLSARLGEYVRTNSESLIGIVSDREDLDFSQGIAIGSILKTDEHSHIEPCRYSAGSDSLRFLAAPHVAGSTALQRIINLARAVSTRPRAAWRAFVKADYARRTTILLYMRSLEGHITLTLGRDVFTSFRRGLTTRLGDGPAPTNAIPEATRLAQQFAEQVDGYPVSLVSETLLGIPSTAHILGGCSFGRSAEEGVIDTNHEVFNYPGLYVVDGSAISANPGVNPALTITAQAERALSKIPRKR